MSLSEREALIYDKYKLDILDVKIIFSSPDHTGRWTPKSNLLAICKSDSAINIRTIMVFDPLKLLMFLAK